MMEKVGGGKIRNLYRDKQDSVELPGQTEFYIEATDRVSAFDDVLPGLEIPEKGEILTRISRKWAQLIDDRFETSCSTAYLEMNEKRVKHVRDTGLDPARTQCQLFCQMVPVEAIVRFYMTGSLWQAYKAGERQFCGVELPEGLREFDRLPEPIFTPTTKAPIGEHDENLTFNQMVEYIEQKMKKEIADSVYADARELATEMRHLALEVFGEAYEYALRHDVLIIDTKFEFGLEPFGGLLLADEILTPDSSRFCLEDDYMPGISIKSMDKQIIRNYIAKWRAGHPELNPRTDLLLPLDIIQQTQEAYWEIYRVLFP